jgi:hypothetical protein
MGLFTLDAGEAPGDVTDGALTESMGAPAKTAKVGVLEVGADTVVDSVGASASSDRAESEAIVSTGSPLLGLYVTLSKRPHAELMLNKEQYTLVTRTETSHCAVVQLSMPCCRFRLTDVIIAPLKGIGNASRCANMARSDNKNR